MESEVFNHTSQQSIPTLITCLGGFAADRASRIIVTLEVHEELAHKPEALPVSLTGGKALLHLPGKGLNLHTPRRIRLVTGALAQATPGGVTVSQEALQLRQGLVCITGGGAALGEVVQL